MYFKETGISNLSMALHVAMDRALKLMAFCLGQYLDGLFRLKKVKSPDVAQKENMALHNKAI